MFKLSSCRLLSAAVFMTVATVVQAADPALPTPPTPAASAPLHDAGWRVFQANCARCHGADAAGTASAPDLLVRVRGMSQGRFEGSVLRRYQWVVPSGDARSEGAAREALVQDVLGRRDGDKQMPAWEKDPTVRASIGKLWAYLDARASGALGPDQPTAR